jgi:hypothetical protein
MTNPWKKETEAVVARKDKAKTGGSWSIYMMSLFGIRFSGSTLKLLYLDVSERNSL